MSDARRLKIDLLSRGVVLSERAHTTLTEITGEQGLSSADYASTSGVILKLDDNVWVNAPIETHNPNFAASSPYLLDSDNDGFFIEGKGLHSRANFWPQPQYHGTVGPHGPWNNFVVTHADRVRLSPIRSCAMTCDFCNIPFDDPIETYTLKNIDACIDALRLALTDPRQPAQHILISGGTPKPKDVGNHHELYRRVLTEFPDVDVDIMMAPIKGLFQFEELRDLGVNQLSINLEIADAEISKKYMRNKYNQGRDYYLEQIAEAVDVLGPFTVRSMLMVGLEPLESTLEGVAALSRLGAVPVLSPFRPDPSTPLRDLLPPSSELMTQAFEEGQRIAADNGSYLGPDCAPCSHNTLNFGEDRHGTLGTRHQEPLLF